MLVHIVDIADEVIESVAVRWHSQGIGETIVAVWWVVLRTAVLRVAELQEPTSLCKANNLHHVTRRSCNYYSVCASSHALGCPAETRWSPHWLSIKTLNDDND